MVGRQSRRGKDALQVGGSVIVGVIVGFRWQSGAAP